MLSVRPLTIVLLLGSMLLFPRILSAQEEMISLTELAPELMQQMIRNRKFYGDPLTVGGDVFNRSYVTGDWGGCREALVDNGLYSYIGMTQFFEGNIDGGNARKLRGNGTLDYAFWLDSGKAGLWPGGVLYARGETGWAEDKNADMGSAVPSNFDAVMPDPDTPKTAFSEFYAIQGLGENLLVAAGKMDLATWADTNLFANNWRYQFSYTSLVNNPQLGAVVPYTTFANWWAFTLTEQATLIYTINTADSIATTAGFDTIFNGNMVNSLLLILTPEINGKPGLYNVLVGYDSSNTTDFAIDPRQALDQILGLVPIQQRGSNYGVFISGSQYLWTYDSGHCEGCPHAPSRPLGVGVFFRYGWTPQDRNVITQFASAGIAGYGGPFGRIHDNWGVGWGGSYISSDLRNAVSLVETLSPWEHGVEAYYNFRITPSTHLTLNFQVIDSTVKRIDTATAVGSRLQIDF